MKQDNKLWPVKRHFVNAGSCYLKTFQMTHELANKSNRLQRRRKVITGSFGSDSFLGSIRESVKVKVSCS